jgi:hypothetical protein
VEFHFVGIRPQDERAARHKAKDIFVVEVFSTLVPASTLMR